MNLEHLSQAVIQLAKRLGALVLFVCQRYWFTVIAAAVAVSLLLTILSWLQDAAVIHYTLLDGPAGGTGREQSQKIADAITGRSSLFGYRYAVQIDHTNGYQENQERIGQDRSGRMLGFAHDGFDNGETIRVLLPLEKTVLHIFARRKFLEEHKLLPARTVAAADDASILPAGAPAGAISLANVVPFLRPGRCFLGPKGSGTYQAAKTVLEHYVGDADRFQTHGVADWNEMRAAFHTGQIDVAFCGTRIGAKSVTRIARDGVCVLLDLGPDAQTICQTESQLTVGQILKNSYANGSGFCADNLQTVSMRRVLICSDSMSDRDAWFLCEAGNSALRPDIGDLHLAEAAQKTPLRFLPHDGALQFWDNRTVSYLPQGLIYFGLTLLFGTAVELLRFAAVRLQVTSKPPIANYARLFAEIENLQARVEAAERPLTEERRDAFLRDARQLRRRVMASARARQFPEHRRDMLMAGLQTVVRMLVPDEGRPAPSERPVEAVETPD